MGVFRLTTSTTQSLAASTELGLNFGSTVFDPDGATSAPGICIVPAAWNGLYGQFSCGVEISGFGDLYLLVSRSTNGGSTWTPYISGDTVGSTQFHYTKGPWLELITGDQYRITYFGDAETIVAGGANFFSCQAVDTSDLPLPPTGATTGAFRAIKADGQQLFAQLVGEEITFNTTVFDSFNGYLNNRFTVPVELNGKYMYFNAGISNPFVEMHEIEIQVSTDGGTIWTPIAKNGENSSLSLVVGTGPTLVATGEIYRAYYQTLTSGSNVDPTEMTFFSGYVSN